MEKNLTVRIFKIVSLILILAAVVSIVLVWSKGDVEIRDNAALQNQLLNPYFMTAYIALGLCIILSLLFPVINIITQPKNAVRVLIGLGALVLIGVIAFAVSGNEFTELQLRDLKTTEIVSRRVGAALIGTYVIGAAAVLAILFAEVTNFVKR
jgi:hypothetical protein